MDAWESGRNWWMLKRVGRTGECAGEWKKLVDARESGRNWWMHGRVGETGGCSREREELVNAWEIETV